MHTQSTFRGEPQLSNQRNTTGRRPRITGIDVARAIAIIGMAYAHLGPIFVSSDIDTVASLLTTGFASALFAVLAGVSVSIMSQRGVEKGGVELAQSRQQLMLRGTILIGIGLVLSIAPSAPSSWCFPWWRAGLTGHFGRFLLGFWCSGRL